jgi:lipopolysaccharide transport system permease protein
MRSATAVPGAEVIITPSASMPLRAEILELWAYRELLYFLVWRDVKVRYKQTFFGAAWAVIQPLSAMVVFTVFFGRLVRVPSDGLPYPLFAYAALLPWSYFAQSVTHAASSVVASAHLVTKVYLPRLAIPMAAVLSGVVDFGVAFLVLVVMMLLYGAVPGGLALIFVPAFFILALVVTLGVGLWLAALNVAYRDVGHAAPFLVQLWLFATPVVYPSSLLPEPWRTLWGLNPMTGVVEGFRAALLGTRVPTLMLLLSAAAALLIAATGFRYFRRVQKGFSDLV